VSTSARLEAPTRAPECVLPGVQGGPLMGGNIPDFMSQNHHTCTLLNLNPSKKTWMLVTFKHRTGDRCNTARDGPAGKAAAGLSVKLLFINRAKGKNLLLSKMRAKKNYTP